MDAQRSSALMEWSAWTSLLLAWGQSVELALLDTQEMHRSAMVSLKHFSYGVMCNVWPPFRSIYQLFNVACRKVGIISGPGSKALQCL